MLGGILLLIHRMTAVFGRLQNRTLELREGLNIIQAPNESGKSTWCAFLAAMFYGINSRERDRTGFIAEKKRYAPWTGSAMSGRLDCQTEYGDLTLTRSTRRATSPMGDFQALYAGTGDAVPDLTGQSCGEMLLGVSREVFERSALIRQAGLPVSQDAGLERRIAALITAGEEDSSYMEAAAALRGQLNRRRRNQSGKLPKLEAELQDTERQLLRLEALEQQIAQVHERLDGLSQKESALSAELASHERWNAQQSRRTLEDAESSALQAEQRALAMQRQLEAEQVPTIETITRLRGAIVNLKTTQKNAERARAERDSVQEAVHASTRAMEQTPFAGMTPEQVEALPLEQEPRPRFPMACAIIFPILGILLGAGLYFIGQDFLPSIAHGCAIAGGCGLSGLGILLTGLFTARRQKRWEEHASLLRRQRQEDLELFTTLYHAAQSAQLQLEAKSAAYRALYDSFTANERAILSEVRRYAPTVSDLSAADEALRAGAVQRKDLAEAAAKAREARLRAEFLSQQSPALETEAATEFEEIPPPRREREVVESDLEAVRVDLATVRSELDHLTGQLHALGDPVVLNSIQANLKAEIARLEGEYAAIQLALETLESANTLLQSHFSPALGRRAAEIFTQLTGGRYSGVVLDQNFHFSAETSEDGIYRSTAFLSAGTLDQLYLSVRLAICELVLPAEKQVPIILDDALANFDDIRCAEALRHLRQESERRQIVLFTCHSREAAFFADDPAVFIQQMDI